MHMEGLAQAPAWPLLHAPRQLCSSVVYEASGATTLYRFPVLKLVLRMSADNRQHRMLLCAQSDA